MKKIKLTKPIIIRFILILLLLTTLVVFLAILSVRSHNSSDGITTLYPTIVEPPSPTPYLTPAPTKVPHLAVNTPTLDIKSSVVATSEGNVYLISGSNLRLLIDKQANSNYDNRQTDLYFLQAEFSPDKSKMFLRAEGLYSHPTLFYLDMDQLNNSQNIGSTYEAKWSPNSQFIAFISGGGDCGPQDIGLVIYNTQNNTSYSLAGLNHLPSIPNLKFDSALYSNLAWLPDSSGVSIHYDAYSREAGCGPMGDNVGEGTIVLPLSKKFDL